MLQPLFLKLSLLLPEGRIGECKPLYVLSLRSGEILFILSCLRGSCCCCSSHVRRSGALRCSQVRITSCCTCRRDCSKTSLSGENTRGERAKALSKPLRRMTVVTLLSGYIQNGGVSDRLAHLKRSHAPLLEKNKCRYHITRTHQRRRAWDKDPHNTNSNIEPPRSAFARTWVSWLVSVKQRKTFLFVVRCCQMVWRGGIQAQQNNRRGRK